MLNIKLSIAQNESDTTSDRIKFVFNQNKEKGKVICGHHIFGYNITDKRYTINKKEWESDDPTI
jgi:DNA invertase Pin-like site-specific DNA recombinase